MIIPGLANSDEGKWAVEICKYDPVGRRGFAPTRVVGSVVPALGVMQKGEELDHAGIGAILLAQAKPVGSHPRPM